MKIVFTNGCFDILHRGHVEYLKASAALGDYLIVGINSDESVKRLKGPLRPINNQNDRKYMLEQFPFINDVIIFDEDTPAKLIQKVNPQIVTKGGDYSIERIKKDAPNAEVILIPFKEGYSTTKILEKVK